MEEKRNRPLNCATAIMALLPISVIFTVFGQASSFFYYDSTKVGKEWVYELVFSVPDIGDIVYLLLSIAPVILFALYIFRYYSKGKATIIVPIVFGLLAVESIVQCFFYNVIIAQLLLACLLLVAPCTLALISALKGLYKKRYVIIAMSIGLLLEVIELMNFFSSSHYYIEKSMWMYLFVIPMRIFGTSAFCIAMLLFALKNRIPYLLALSPEKEKAKVGKMRPEQALELLNYKLEANMITEEDYQAQRADIISKL